MKKILNILLGVVLIVIGVLTSFFAVSLLPQISDWVMIVLIITFFFSGIAIGISGIRIFQGDKISTILSDLLRGLGR